MKQNLDFGHFLTGRRTHTQPMPGKIKQNPWVPLAPISCWKGEI